MNTVSLFDTKALFLGMLDKFVISGLCGDGYD
jgi:hypothetical protein